jgi:hypothetical protein
MKSSISISSYREKIKRNIHNFGARMREQFNSIEFQHVGIHENILRI